MEDNNNMNQAENGSSFNTNKRDDFTYNGQNNYDPMTGQPTKEYLKKKQIYHDNTDSTAKKLCWASLISWITGNALLFGEDLFYAIFGEFYSKVVGPIAGLCLIAGLVLLIVALVNYPKNKFAKVLLIVYLLEIILVIIAFIMAVIACALLIESCFTGCYACYRIG